MIVWFLLIVIFGLSYYILKKDITIGRVLGLFLVFILVILRLMIYYNLIDFNPDLNNLDNIISLEWYRDFEYYYVNWNSQYRYILKTRIYFYLFNYQYPPLFIQLLSLFYKFEYILFVGSYLLSVIVFLKILKELKINKEIIFFYMLNPIMLFYCGFNFFISSVLLLFVLLSFYYLIKENSNYNISIIFLTFSILIKQYLIILLPFWILYIIVNEMNEFSWKFIIKKHIKYGLICFSLILFIYLPYLIFDFKNTINKTLIGGIGFILEDIKGNTKNLPVTFVSMLISFNVSDFFVNIIGYLLLSWIFFIIGYILIYFNYFKHISKENSIVMLLFGIIGVLFVNHLFYPRGSFKYYLVVLIPFILLFYYYFQKRDLINGNLWIYLFIILVFARQFYFVLIIIWFVWFIRYIFKFEKEYYCIKIL